MAIPLQWVLANTCCVLAEDSYHWMDFPTTICDIGKKLTTHNILLWFLGLEAWPIAHSDKPNFSCVCSSLTATEENVFRSSNLLLYIWLLARTPARCAGRSCKSDRRLWIRCQDEFGIWPFCNSSEKVEDNEPCIYRNKIVFFTHRGCIAIIGAVGLANGKRSWESEH